MISSSVRLMLGGGEDVLQDRHLAQKRPSTNGDEILLLQESAQDVDFAFLEADHLIGCTLADNRFGNAANVGRALLLRGDDFDFEGYVAVIVHDRRNLDLHTNIQVGELGVHQ